MTIGTKMDRGGAKLKKRTWGTSRPKDSPGSTAEENLLLTSICAFHEFLSISMAAAAGRLGVSSFLLRAVQTGLSLDNSSLVVRQPWGGLAAGPRSE